jgi:hypothetical protein
MSNIADINVKDQGIFCNPPREGSPASTHST